ncbi:hydroxyethylthiazole kinase [Breznakiellaceae bacterium SP9]
MNEAAEHATKIIDEVRERSPLIHCITNYITINDCANILLSFGASPAMIDSPDEAYGFARIASALYVNLGDFIKEQEKGAEQAVLGARDAGIPIVLDPVGCGAIPKRIGITEQLHRIAALSIIKGNMGEIMALYGKNAGAKGVDSADSIAGIEEAVVELALRYGCTVAATGKVDIVSDGKRLARIENGVAMLKTITGAGCMVGALCAGAAAAAKLIGHDMFSATIAGIASMGIAGELAANLAAAPGSFRVALIDSIYTVTGETLRANAYTQVL